MKFMIFIKFLLNWLITHVSNSVKIFHSIIAMKYIEIDLLISSMFIGPCLITLVLIWDARTRHPGQCTRVRRGGTRQGRRRPRVRAASDRVVPRGKSRIRLTRLKSAPIRRKSALMWPKLGRLGPYRPKRPSQAEIQKKKNKKGENAPFD